MRVRLVVTGDMERLSLGSSLARSLQAAGANVRFEAAFKVSGGAMTTNPLPDPSNRLLPIPTPIQRMARALVTETVSGPSGTRPDLVIGVDDLELANAHQPGVVTAWLRRALHDEIEARFPSYPSQDAANHVREALRSRCSFHLLVPLAEGYFFGEPAAVTRAGVAPGVAVHRLGADVEDFATDDPGFLPLTEARNAEMTVRNYPWWREERHPKRYLDFLVQRSGGIYDETRGGRAALETLDWPLVGAAPGAAQFARALFEDLSEALGIENPLGVGATARWTYPLKTVRPETLTLRNL
jgi:hypothetical protein